MLLIMSRTGLATQVKVNGVEVFLDTYEADAVGSGPTPADVGAWGYTGGTVRDYDPYEGEKHLEITNDTGAVAPYAGVTSASEVVRFTTMIKLPTTFTNWWDWQLQGKNAADDTVIFNLVFSYFGKRKYLNKKS